MFQPLTESYIRAVAETSLDRHRYESDEERAEREGRVYEIGNLPGWVFCLVNTLGQALATAGSASVSAVRQFRASPRRRPTFL